MKRILLNPTSGSLIRDLIESISPTVPLLLTPNLTFNLRASVSQSRNPTLETKAVLTTIADLRA